MPFQSTLRLRRASVALRRFRAANTKRHVSPLNTAGAAEWTPLCERPAERVVQWPAVLKWRQHRTSQLQQQAITYDIPLSELQIEFRWLQEDALAARREKEGDPWIPVHKTLFLEDASHGEAAMRLDLSDLDALWMKRLTERVPIQYLTNTVHWRDVILTVGPGVLIPRPETEQLIDLAANALDNNPALLQAPWADLGTGSGALALCLARLLQQRGSHAPVLATDQSALCLSCAERNANRLGLRERLRFLEGSWFDPLKAWKGKLGGILSNPPYIPTSHLPTLQPEVTLHEPHSALDGGSEGYAALSTLLHYASEYLIPGGMLILETQGSDQIQLLLQECKALSVRHFQNVRVHSDVYGRERFMVAIK